MPVVHDNHSKNLNLPLPDKDNFLQDDVERLIETINTLDAKVATKAADGKLDPAQLPNVAATLEGGVLNHTQVPPRVVQVEQATGKIAASKLPQEGLTNTFIASSQATMLTLKATLGDICKRLDTNSYFILANYPPTDRFAWRELPLTAVSSINGRSGALTNIAESGVNHDITDLTGLTGQLHLPVDGTDEMAAVTRRQLDKAGGGYVSQVVWHHNRTNIPDGYLIGDGQEVSETLLASLYAEVQAGRVPVCTEAEWWANPGKRGCYTLGATPGMFRVPDYNGVQSGSFAAPFLRGSYQSDEQYKGWMQQNAAPNIKGTFQIRKIGAGGVNTYGLTGAFTAPTLTTGTPLTNLANQTGTTSSSLPEVLTLDASLANQAYGRVDGITKVITGEVRPNAVVGCYIIRFAGRALEAGAVDPVATATKLQTLYADVKKLNNTVGYELIDFGNIALSSRTVKPNPFGNLTPVVAIAEVKLPSGKWINTGWAYQTAVTSPAVPSGGYGVQAHFVEGEGIVVQVGSLAFTANSASGGASGVITTPINTGTMPCRVHVWNLGKDTTQLTLAREAVSKLSDLWLPANDPRVLEYIEWPSDVVFSEAGIGNQVSPGELLVNIKSNAIQIKGILRRPFKASLPTATVGTGAVTATVSDANYKANALNHRVFKIKKMLPGFTSIPRCYGTGLIDFVITGFKAQDATKTITTVPSGRAILYCGMNDGAHLRFPAEYLNCMTISDFPVQDFSWYIFDCVVPFA
ncbi:hypothetical protein D7B12_17785 [Salmonella enterica]|nr:hypothetical protein [Salmonella enterica]